MKGHEEDTKQQKSRFFFIFLPVDGGFGSRMPKNIRILPLPIRIRLRNTGLMLEPNTNLLSLPSEFYQMDPDPAAGRNHESYSTFFMMTTVPSSTFKKMFF